MSTGVARNWQAARPYFFGFFEGFTLPGLSRLGLAAFVWPLPSPGASTAVGAAGGVSCDARFEVFTGGGVSCDVWAEVLTGGADVVGAA